MTRSGVQVLPPLADAHTATSCAAIGPARVSNVIGTVVLDPPAAVFVSDTPCGTIRGQKSVAGSDVSPAAALNV